MKWNFTATLCILLSTLAISLSWRAIAIANARVGKVEHDPSGFYGWACAFLGMIITILMAWQIFQTISVDIKIANKIKKVQSDTKEQIMNEYYGNHYNLLKILWNDFRDTQKWNILIDTHLKMMDLSLKLKNDEVVEDILNKCEELLKYAEYMKPSQINNLKEIGRKINSIAFCDKRFAKQLEKKYKEIPTTNDIFETNTTHTSSKTSIIDLEKTSERIQSKNININR